MTTRFEELATELRTSGRSHVDAREWSTKWVDAWVVFADLIAFGPRCRRSDETALNNIIRFHRCVDVAARDAGSVDVHLFTDACYGVSTSLLSALAFASDLQHTCLAMNAVELSHGRPLFHRLIVPRLTLARGSVLQASHDETDGPRTDITLSPPDRLLAGTGIVEAYLLERQCVGGDVLVQAGIPSQRIAIRGRRNHARKHASLWLDEARRSDRPHLLPWTLLRPSQGKHASGRSELWTDDYGSIMAKLRTLDQVWRLSFAEFVADESSPSVAKHYAAGTREVARMLKVVRGGGHKIPWDPVRLRSELGKP